MSKIYKNDNGTIIRVDVKLDVSAATYLGILVKKPDGSIVDWVGQLTPNSLTSIDYVILPGDLDQPGVYTCQSKITLPGWSGLGDTFKLIVYDTFA
jgi:hypothetical protein